jgi:beta-glucosidase
LASNDSTEPPAPHVDQWIIKNAQTSDVGWPSPSCTSLASGLLSKMTLAEKIGQMTQPARGSFPHPSDVGQFAFGSVLSGGGSGPPRNEPAAWLAMVNEYASFALNTRLKIPLIYGIDAVHGHNNVHDAVIFPHNIGLGCTRDPELVEKIARATAEEMSATGIDWTFAPVVAAARDERWGRTYEAFGETAELAELLGTAAIRGYQGKRLGQASPAVLACAKHFAADGGTWSGHDRGNSLVDAETMFETHLRQYQAAVRAGVGSIMVSYSSVNGEKMHSRRDLLTDVLKGRMGFAGFLVSDYAAIEQLPGNYSTQVESAINAGVDMVMGPKRFQNFLTTLTSLVPSRVPVERIDDAVKRILTVKCELGLFAPTRTRPPLSTIGSSEHRTLARQAVSQTLVVLKNQGNLLPLDPNTPSIHVAGKNADDLGHQCGGWSISWQGASGPITTGTTIRRGLELGAARGARVTYSRDASGAKGANVVIAVVGERPYAEGNGDRRVLELDSDDLSVIRNAKQSGAKVVVVLITGRPIILGEVADSVDAIIAAWLPGSEGAGVADVIYGAVKPKGKLSHSWPKSAAQIPINFGDASYSPLFPYGYGLTYPEQTQ